jgi:hypothetical protein
MLLSPLPRNFCDVFVELPLASGTLLLAAYMTLFQMNFCVTVQAGLNRPTCMLSDERSERAGRSKKARKESSADKGIETRLMSKLYKCNIL